jgi:hypothetical protein
MPSSAEWGRRAEEAAARKYNLRRERNTWYDAVYESNGRKVQVKATRRILASGRPGRYRFWLKDHKLLKEHSGGYVLVLYHPSAGIRKIEKASTSAVEEAANWINSGHKLRSGSGQQAKIRWDELL